MGGRRRHKPDMRIPGLKKQGHFVLSAGRKTEHTGEHALSPIGIYPISKASNTGIGPSSKTSKGHVVAYRQKRKGPEDRRMRGSKRYPADRKIKK